MFSQLAPLFKTHIRKTESNDTRQHIPHEEQNNYRVKNEEEDKGNTPEEKWTDDTVVSINALKSFLINFLKTLPDSDDSAFLKSHDTGSQGVSRPKEKVRPTNTHNAKAVRAYQTMASHSVPNTAPEKPKEKETPKNNAPTADKLQSKELRDIHNLIIDLEYLESKNIRELNILKANTFVEGMKNAVALIKSKI